MESFEKVSVTALKITSTVDTEMIVDIDTLIKTRDNLIKLRDDANNDYTARVEKLNNYILQANVLGVKPTIAEEEDAINIK